MREIQHNRIAELIREKVASIIEYKLQDPRRAQLTITITRVKLAKDLSRCTVFYSVLGNDKAKGLAAHLLKHAQGFVRTEIANSLETRRVPFIEFAYDETIEKSIQLSKKIDEVMKGKKGPQEQSRP